MASKDRDIKQNISAVAQVLRSCAKPIVDGLVFVLPIAIQYTKTAYTAYSKLPQNCIHFIYGSVFCFFGGSFPTLFAAIQAAEYGGRKAVIQAFSDLSDEATTIINESKKDDDANANKNELTSSEYLTRKTKLVLQKMNPEKVDNAISCIYTVWLSVVAVLSIEFARTISMALAMADFLKKPLDRFVTPVVQQVCPDEYDKWVPIVMSWIAKSAAMSVAWYIQTIVSAFSSALKGGLMMAEATYRFCLYRNIGLFGLITPNEKDSVVDEGLAYLFSAVGFYAQFRLGFKLPTPINLFLFPFSMAEYYIKWSITKKTA